MPAPRAKASLRLDWLDALKGVGILAVVVGHVWTRGAVRDAIYMVHMPLFFIASGYTLRALDMRALIPRLLNALVIPFLMFSALLLLADLLIEGWRGMRPIYASFGQGLVGILLDSAHTRGPFTILWFVPALLLARVAWNGLALVWPDPADWRWVLAVLALLMGAAVLLPLPASPLAVQAVPGALACLWLGALWRREEPRIAALPGWLTGVAMLLALAAFILLPPLDMKQGHLGVPLLSLIAALLVTVLIAAALRRAPHSLVALLARIGRMSLVIMYVHVAFIHYLAPYVPPVLLLCAALAGSAFIDWGARQIALSRRLLLGERG